MSYFLEFLRQFNWVDIAVFVCFIRIIVIALRNGIATESLKFVGTFTAVYLALHYYSSIAYFLAQRFDVKLARWHWIDLVVYLVLILIGYGIFWVVRLLLKRFINTEIEPVISKWGALILGVLRGFWVVSLMLYFLLIPQREYLQKSVHSSFSGSSLVHIAPATYSWFWNGIMSKFLPQDQFNNTVFHIEQKKIKQNR